MLALRTFLIRSAALLIGHADSLARVVPFARFSWWARPGAAPLAGGTFGTVRIGTARVVAVVHALSRFAGEVGVLAIGGFVGHAFFPGNVVAV
jgi:hypothetical protein